MEGEEEGTMHLSNDPLFDSFRNGGIKGDGWMDSPRWRRFSRKIGSMLYAEPLYEKGFLSWEEDWVQGNPVKKYKETVALRLSWGEIGREDT